MTDLEQDLRTMLATRAADPVARPDTYEQVRRRVAVRRQRRNTVAAALSVVAVAATGLVVTQVRGRDLSPAARLLSWPARGNAVNDAQLVESAAATWDTVARRSGGGGRSGNIRLLWAGTLPDDASAWGVWFETVDPRRGARLVLVAGPRDALRVLGDVEAPGRDVDQVSIAVTSRSVTFGAGVPGGPAGTPQEENEGDMPVLAAPGASVTRVVADAEEWGPADDVPNDGMASFAGRYDDPDSIRITVRYASGGTATSRPTALVPEGSADPEPEPFARANEVAPGATAPSLGWSNRNGAHGVSDLTNPLLERIVAAVQTAAGLSESVPMLVHWKATLSDGTVGLLASFEHPDGSTRLVLYSETDPVHGVAVVGRPLVEGEVVRQVSAVIRTSGGRRALLVLGSPLVREIRWLPAGGEPSGLRVRDGWGLLPLDRAATAADRVEVRDPDGRWTGPVTFR